MTRTLLPILALLVAGCAQLEPAPAGTTPAVEIENRTLEPIRARLLLAVPGGSPFVEVNRSLPASGRISPALPDVPLGDYDVALETGGRSRAVRIQILSGEDAFRFIVEPDRIGFQVVRPLR